MAFVLIVVGLPLLLLHPLEVSILPPLKQTQLLRPRPSKEEEEYDDGGDMWARGAFRQGGSAGSANGFRERRREGGGCKKDSSTKRPPERAGEPAPKTRAHYSNQRERTDERTHEGTKEQPPRRSKYPSLSSIKSFLRVGASTSLLVNAFLCKRNIFSTRGGCQATCKMFLDYICSNVFLYVTKFGHVSLLSETCT